MIFKRKLTYEGRGMFLRINIVHLKTCGIFCLNACTKPVQDRDHLQPKFLFLNFFSKWRKHDNNQPKKQKNPKGHHSGQFQQDCRHCLFHLHFWNFLWSLTLLFACCINSFNVTPKGTLIFKWVSSQNCKLLHMD